MTAPDFNAALDELMSWSPSPDSDDYLEARARVESMYAEALAEVERLRAVRDRLMLEYCPDEMTPEQVAEWEKHQVPVGRDALLAQAREEVWIDLNVQMPEPEVFVLAWDGKRVGVDWWGSKRHRGDGVTHWLPFAAPPGAGPMYGMHSRAASVEAQQWDADSLRHILKADRETP